MKTVFLPGATGDAAFWRPVAASAGLHGDFLAWPGLGRQPPRPGIEGLDDLVTLAARRIDEPVDIVAQSMGGVVALRLALLLPHRLRRLVLCATSGGLPVDGLGGSDWRRDYFDAFPQAARWIGDPVADLSARLAGIRAPTLLLWGDADPISPVAVGERLAALLPDARLEVVPGGDHDLAVTHAGTVGRALRRHLHDGSGER